MQTYTSPSSRPQTFPPQSPTQKPGDQKFTPQKMSTEAHHGNINTASSVSGAPTHDEIAKKAYEIYANSGCKQGNCQQNWRQAEQELRSGRRPG